MPAQTLADAAAAAVEPPVGRERQHRAAGRPEGHRPGCDVRASGRQRPGRHRAERIGQVVAGARAGRGLAAGARQGAARRRRARSVVVRRARPPCRLSAAGRRTVRRHRRPEYLPLRSRGRFRCHHRRRQGSRRPRDDHQDARRLRHPDRRAGRRAFGRSGAARGAGEGAVWRSVPDRAGRAEFQSRHRGRRGADPGDSRGARARRHRGGGRAPADRHRGGRSAAGAQGRPHAGLRSQGNRSGSGAAAGSPPPSPDQDRFRRGSCQIMTDGEERGARRSIRLHLIVGLAVVVVLAGGLGGWASTAQISGALIAPGSVVVEFQRQESPASDRRRGRRSAGARRRSGQGRRRGGAARRHRHQGQPRDRHQEPRRVVGAGGAARGRTARPRQDRVSADAARPCRRSRCQERHRQRDQAVRGPHHRPDRAEGAIARAGHAAQRGNRRPHRAGEGQGSGNQAGGKGAGRSSRALRPASGADFAPDDVAARRRPAQRRARAIHRLTGAGQGQDHRNRTADHPGRQGSGQRSLQGFARDQRQDRRICRAQGHRRRPVAAGRHPGPAGRHGAAIHGSHRRRRDHRRRRHHDDRAAGRRPLGRGQGQSAGYRQVADRPEDPAAAVGLQPAHHAGIERRRHPRFGRRHHRAAHRAELLHDPGLDAAGRGRAARRRQADPRHAGGGLCADRRPHHDVLSDQAAERPADAGVPGEVNSSPLPK